MDKTIKTKWVKALRSGRYRQARESLKRGNSYCCLGVLCEVLGAKWNRLEGERVAVLGDKTLNSPGEEVLRPFVLRSVGLTKFRQSALTNLNDGNPNKGTKPQNFKQIADYIEENL